MLVPDLEAVKKSGPGENDRESFWIAGLERGSAGRARPPARETPNVAPNAGQLKDLSAVLIPSGNMVRSRLVSTVPRSE